jgi:hypothetical protein
MNLRAEIQPARFDENTTRQKNAPLTRRGETQNRELSQLITVDSRTQSMISNDRATASYYRAESFSLQSLSIGRNTSNKKLNIKRLQASLQVFIFPVDDNIKRISRRERHFGLVA